MRRKLELLMTDEAEQELATLMRDTRWLEDIYRRNVSLSLYYFFRESAFDGMVDAGFGKQPAIEEAMIDFIIAGIEQKEFPYDTGTLGEMVGGKSVTSKNVDQTLARKAVKRRWSREIRQVSKSLAEAFTATK